MGLEKSLKKGWKSVEDTGEDIIDGAAKTGKDAIDWVGDTSSKAYKEAVDEVEDLVDTVSGLSAAAQGVANSLTQMVDDIGDLADALLDDMFNATLEQLVDIILSDYASAFDAAVDYVLQLADDSKTTSEVIDALNALASDMTDEGKEVFVQTTHPFIIIDSYASVMSDMGFDTITIGVTGDLDEDAGVSGASGVGANSGDLHDAYQGKEEAKDVPMAVYAGYSVDMGIGAEADGGIELGADRSGVGKLSGSSLGVSLGAVIDVGASLGVFLNADDFSFSGFSVVPMVGEGVEFKVSTSQTTARKF